MVLRAVFTALAIGFFLIAVPQTASAHRDHDPPDEVETVAAERAASEELDAIAESSHQQAEQTASETNFVARLGNWLGRTHPMLVHFPIALFPVGLLATIFARRRRRWDASARLLVGLAGLASIPAALLGWFGAGFGITSDETLLLVHRWLGTGIALAGSYLMVVAWRGGNRVKYGTALGVLVLVNIALVFQGWYGGALVHGADHLAW